MKFSDTCYKSMIASAFIASAITVGASAQDECATAVTVTAGVPAAFDTTTATPSADIPADTLCAGTFLTWADANGVGSQDVWMQFTATEPGTVEFSTCDAASYDTSMALYLGNCANLIACNGDGVGQAGCQAFYSRISGIVANTGDVFYCRIGGYEGATATGSLLVTFTTGSAACFGATGACNVAHGGLGCDNVICCGTICGFNPLCCDTGWDQSCVDLAIELCGYYSCPAVAGAPANDCATNATLIPSVSSNQAFNTVAATTDGPDHPGQCNSGSDIFASDVWWKVVAGANGSMGLSTCSNVSFDNKLAVYDLGTDPASFDYNLLAAALVGCNDDGPADCNTTGNPVVPYASAMSVNVVLGNTYLIRTGSYADGDTGSGILAVTMPETCAIGSSNTNEQEPCGSAFNDGCNGAGQSEAVSVGSIVAGSFWADADTRDTDFYSFSVAASSQVTVSVKAARNATVLILSGDLTVAECAGVTVLTGGAGSCPTVATFCLNPGTYYVFVADAGFTGNPCGSGDFNKYTVAITSAPASCPIVVSGGAALPGVCDAPGPDSMSLNTDPNAVTTGVVSCAVNPASPNCGAGGTTANSYARVFPAGTVSGDISCVNFGVYSVVRAANAAGTACALYYSDIPLPSTIGIYEDLDGGNPRFVTADGGTDGGDLSLIFEQACLIPGGVYRATLNLTQPLCVEDHVGKNLVVIMDCPDLYAGAPGVPAASGYGIRAGANAAGPVSNTWIRLSCADGAGQYVLSESLGATFTAQWVVQLNGNNAAGCNAPACIGDYNNDGIRNGADLTTLLSAWGTPDGDITGDGTTNGADLTTLLSGWGACPN